MPKTIRRRQRHHAEDHAERSGDAFAAFEAQPDRENCARECSRSPRRCRRSRDAPHRAIPVRCVRAAGSVTRPARARSRSPSITASHPFAASAEERDQPPLLPHHPPDVRRADIAAAVRADVDALRLRDDQPERNRAEQIGEQDDDGDEQEAWSGSAAECMAPAGGVQADFGRGSFELGISGRAPVIQA